MTRRFGNLSFFLKFSFFSSLKLEKVFFRFFKNRVSLLPNKRQKLKMEEKKYIPVAGFYYNKNIYIFFWQNENRSDFLKNVGSVFINFGLVLN